MWVGVDDTDSPRGGCTTFVMTELLRAARDSGLDVLGEPRLVRLNPNVPWKTRGNAALAARFGHGRGPALELGRIDGRAVRGFAQGRPPSAAERDAFFETAWATVLAGARTGEERVDPAMVVSPRALPAGLYRRAVSDLVAVEEVEALLAAAGAEARTRGSPKGLVGAAAALAWPGRRATWELIAYRHPSAAGRPRRLSAPSVLAAQRTYPDLFLCADGRTRRVLIAPHTPCPILFGLRSARRSPLPLARRAIRSEPVERWVIFRTNQGTGDHLRRRPAGALAPYSAGRVRGTVLAGPTVRAGGHVAFSIRDRAGDVLECLAFEPTKTLPRLARRLRPGDRVEVWGGRAEDPKFRLEGIVLLRPVPRLGPVVPPRCPACGRTAHSLGTGRGYRCERCRRRFPPELARPATSPEAPARGAYHPTPSARRHLAPRGPEVPWRGAAGGRIYTGGG